MLHQELFIFDIETVPDIEICKSLLNSKETDFDKLHKILAEYQSPDCEDYKRVFLKPPFHKIVAISFAKVAIEREEGYENYYLKELRSGGTESSSEKDLVKGFFSYLDKNTPRLVTFNGRSFDLPVLKYRAMKYNIATKIYKAGDKWNSYNSRYSLDWHCDLLEAISDFNASGKVRLNEVCSLIGYPGKIDVDGSSVSDLFNAGKIGEIRDYCETDVLNTYLVYLNYHLHRATLTPFGYQNAIDQVIEFLDKNSHLEHFAKFRNLMP